MDRRLNVHRYRLGRGVRDVRCSSGVADPFPSHAGKLPGQAQENVHMQTLYERKLLQN